MLPPKIAVVHNDAAVLNLLITFLEVEGYLPVTYSESDSTVEQMRLAPPDLAIIELGFTSVQRGWTLVDQLRLDTLTHHIPIIVLTTAADPEEVRPQSCGNNCEMLSEPFDLNTIHGLIRSLLKSPQHCHCG